MRIYTWTFQNYIKKKLPIGEQHVKPGEALNVVPGEYSLVYDSSSSSSNSDSDIGMANSDGDMSSDSDMSSDIEMANSSTSSSNKKKVKVLIFLNFLYIIRIINFTIF